MGEHDLAAGAFGLGTLAYLGVVAMAAVVLNAMPAHPAIVRQLDKRFLDFRGWGCGPCAHYGECIHRTSIRNAWERARVPYITSARTGDYAPISLAASPGWANLVSYLQNLLI